MGNPIVFMSAFDIKLKNNNQLPRVMWRYVDDVLAIVKTCDIDKIVETLNVDMILLNSQWKERIMFWHIYFSAQTWFEGKSIAIDFEFKIGLENAPGLSHAKIAFLLKN